MKTKIMFFAAIASLAVACNQPTTLTTSEPEAAQPSVEEQNKKFVNDWMDAVNSRDWQKLTAVYADNYVYYPDDSVRGPQAAVAWVKAFIDAFDIKAHVIQLVAEGDKVAYHIHVAGKHIAPFAGIAPSNRDVSVESIGIVRIENGKIAEEWEIFEETKLMKQIGAMQP